MSGYDINGWQVYLLCGVNPADRAREFAKAHNVAFAEVEYEVAPALKIPWDHREVVPFRVRVRPAPRHECKCDEPRVSHLPEDPAAQLCWSCKGIHRA
jgi:hypothetical protein